MNKLSVRFDNALRRLPEPVRLPIRRIVFADCYRQMRDLCAQAAEADSPSPLRYDCVFIHIPKTGGISVAEALFGQKTGGHRSLRDWQMVLNPKELRTKFTFAFVRNPWDRLVSAFRFLKAGGLNEFDARWAARHLDDVATFDEFVRSWLTPARIWSRQHLWPQYWFVQDRSGVVGVDFIGRFERLEDDYARIRERLGRGAKQLPHVNISRANSPWASAYTRETASKVAELYRTDIALFQYGADAPR